MARGDANGPIWARIPLWGPDRYSLRMAIANMIRGNPAIAATTGIGVRPAPRGASATERTKSTTSLPVQQQTRGANLTYVADPSIRNVPVVAQLPATQVGIDPVLVQLGNRDTRGRWT